MFGTVVELCACERVYARVATGALYLSQDEEELGLAIALAIIQVG